MEREASIWFMICLLYTSIQEKRGYETASEAQTKRDETVGLLYAGEYTVYDDVTVEEFMTYWLEDVMKIKITACSYDALSLIHI